MGAKTLDNNMKECKMGDMNAEFRSYDTMTVTQLALIRELGLEKVETVTDALKEQVRQEHHQGANIKNLARQAGVTRPTIYSWLSQ
jgi:transposase-like protein